VPFPMPFEPAKVNPAERALGQCGSKTRTHTVRYPGSSIPFSK
jgi:hypothetical protein